MTWRGIFADIVDGYTELIATTTTAGSIGSIVIDKELRLDACLIRATVQPFLCGGGGQQPPL